ncbi:VOC family protein [Kingella potus]|uniref:VOC family protein n=1 Tax=Kingella potus TaxID=265175 RepID=UPI0031403800
MMEQHINFITLGVADLAVSRRFYREAFGWRETDGSNENIAFFRRGAVCCLPCSAKKPWPPTRRCRLKAAVSPAFRWRTMSAAKPR